MGLPRPFLAYALLGGCWLSTPSWIQDAEELCDRIEEKSGNYCVENEDCVDVVCFSTYGTPDSYVGDCPELYDEIESYAHKRVSLSAIDEVAEQCNSIDYVLWEQAECSVVMDEQTGELVDVVQVECYELDR